MKYIAAASIFAIAIIIGCIPLIFTRSNKLKSLLDYCNALTTGLFLGVGLTHLLPEAVEHFIENSSDQITSIFVVCAATAIILHAIEHTGKKIAKNRSNHAHWISYFLIIVLSIHSVLEGFVLGFELNPKYEMTMFIAIMAHKGAASFSLITNMLTNYISRYRTIVCLILFSITTPAGILLGKNMLDINLANTNNLIQPYFDSMAAGTFIYIAISNNPYSVEKHRAINISLAIFGFLMMAFLSSFI